MTKVYEELCAGCWRERLCHQDMQLCEAYEAEMEAHLKCEKDKLADEAYLRLQEFAAGLNRGGEG